MADSHKNLAVSAVATAPSPASSGTSLVVTAGHGTRFPAVPFNATIWPDGELPDPSNSEIVRVTAISTDTLTITRAQEGTSARTVIVGDLIAATVTAKVLEDAETAVTRLITQSSHGFAVGDVLRLSAASTYAKAQANSVANAEVAGVVSAVPSSNTFVLTVSGYISGLSGLTAASVYYLDDDTAGLLTLTEPGDNGDVSKPVLISDTTTSGYVVAMRGAVISKHGQFFLPASGMWPSTTNGAAPNAKVDMGTNDVDVFVLDFADGATKLYAQALLGMPSDWDGGTVTAKFYWTKTGTSTNSVVWGCAGRSYGDAETLDQSWGTEQTVTDAGQSTADQLHISADTPAITLAGTPAAGEMVVFRVSRDPTNGSDTLAVTARLLGVMITYSKV